MRLQGYPEGVAADQGRACVALHEVLCGKVPVYMYTGVKTELHSHLLHHTLSILVMSRVLCEQYFHHVMDHLTLLELSAVYRV